MDERRQNSQSPVARHSIAVDSERKLLTMAFAGRFDLRDVEPVMSELAHLEQRLHAGGDTPYRSIIDLRELELHPKETAEAFERVMARFGRLSVRSAVIVSASALQAMQIKRISTGFDVRLFSSIDEGEAWLFATD